MFQSTRPRGARLGLSLIMPCSVSFNPRAREGRDIFLPRDARKGLRFNPRAREGRDALRADGWYLRSVSIHAPARGATRVNTLCIMSRQVSIHAPARGATWFQAAMSRDLPSVSIHAPARGATRLEKQHSAKFGGFNPRAREGRDNGRWKTA